jgi:CDP-diacylglycerol--glycerol-3-phosphate 3-phosphatidyltransferase
VNLPTWLTLLRIALIPVVVAVFYAPVSSAAQICAGLFTLAAVTDWLDGYLARKLGQASSFGAFLDPVADKLIVGAVLVLLVQADPRPEVAIPAAVIIGREITISALREWMAKIGQSRRVGVVMMGKIKTFCQLAAIILMLYGLPEVDGGIYRLGLTLLFIATVLTLYSMILYLWASVPVILASDRAEAEDQ